MRKMTNSGWVGVLMCCAASGLMSSPANAAQGSAPAADGWQFEITPYFWAAGLKGTAGVKDVTADVDLSFNDIVKKVDISFAALFEARKGAWIVGVDTMYLRLKDEGSRFKSGPLGNVSAGADLDMTLTEQIYQPYLGYQLTDGNVKWEVIGGGRYTNLELDLSLTTSTSGPLLPGGQRDANDTQSWWDPIVGARVSAPIAEKWSVFGHADVGIGSNKTYQLLAAAKWQLSPALSANFGYRYLLQNYENGGFKYDDMKMYGPIIGVGYRF